MVSILCLTIGENVQLCGLLRDPQKEKVFRPGWFALALRLLQTNSPEIMDTWIFDHVATVYLTLMASTVVASGIWEGLVPARSRTAARTGRWLMNAILYTFANMIERLLFRVNGLTIALVVSDSAYGLLNGDALPLWLRVSLAFLALDLYQYIGHFSRHSVPLAWRFHQVHHSDTDVDITTGFRFHPGDSIPVHAGYLLVIAILAPP